MFSGGGSGASCQTQVLGFCWWTRRSWLVLQPGAGRGRACGGAEPFLHRTLGSSHAGGWALATHRNESKPTEFDWTDHCGEVSPERLKEAGWLF